jgi:hypothetical protein|tara:strand:+ start:51 stop:398 length:348 start_codon:yes stop_codon:yes gene_type:complete
MVATKATQKSTAMDYLASPRSEGLVVAIMNLLGYSAPKGGRLPAGVKYDTLVALRALLETDDRSQSMMASKIAELQGGRSRGVPKVAANPESIIEAVKAGKISLEELKKKIAELG